MIIYHNPRCHKSRETLELLHSKGIKPEVIEYLKTPLSEKDIRSVLKKLKVTAKDIIRTNEPEFKENFSGEKLLEEEYIKALVKYPKLLQRPIVIKGEKAVIGRPPENVLELI